MKVVFKKAGIALFGLALFVGGVQARQISGAGYWVGYATLQNGAMIGVGPYASASECNAGLQAAIANAQSLGNIVVSVKGCSFVPGSGTGTGNQDNSHL